MTKRTIFIGPDSYELGDRSLAVLRSTAEFMSFLELAHAWGLRRLPLEFIRRVWGFHSLLPIFGRLNLLVKEGAIFRGTEHG